MSVESTPKVRLVRCPKCDNLLPELVDFSVYQCGGCGTVLSAQKTTPEVDIMSEKSDDDRVGRVSIKSDNSMEKEQSNKSENFIEKGISGPDNTPVIEVKSHSSYAARGEDMILSDRDEGKPVTREKYSNHSKDTRNKWSVDYDFNMRNIRDEMTNSRMRKEFEEQKTQMGSGHSSDWQGGERFNMEKFPKNLRTGDEDVRYSTQGPSNNYTSSNYGGYENALNTHNDLERVEYLEQDRAELLRKLDELKSQLSRSCNVSEKPKDKAPLSGRMGHHQEPYPDARTWYANGSTSSSRSSAQFFTPDKPIYNSPFAFGSRHEMGLHGSYPTMNTSQHIPNYVDPNRSHMLGRGPQPMPGPYRHQSSHPYFSGHFVDAHLDPFETNPPNNPAFHHPSCLCFHCYEKHHQVLPLVTPVLGNKKFHNFSNNPTSYNHKNSSAFGSQSYNARIANPSSHDPRPDSRWQNDVNSNINGVTPIRLRRDLLAKNGRICRPIANGAPFVTCCNCFELLQLPKKALLIGKNEQNIQCGACSKVLHCEVLDKKLIVSVHEETKKIETILSTSSDEVVTVKPAHGHMNQSRSTFYSDDFNGSGFDFQSMDIPPIVSSSISHGVHPSKTQETQSLHNSSVTSDEDVDSQDGLIAEKEILNSADLAKKNTVSRPPSGSPLQEHFDYSNNNHQPIDRLGNGNRSSRSDKEKVFPKKTTSRQNSMKDATEMEVSFNEYSNTVVSSHDLGDTSREEIRPRINKGSESFLKGVIKKSFRSSNHTVEDGKINVTINGIPIPDRLIKKAENLAGPVRPGQYWYDVRAGFWGVVGGPCLGIIPPYIEEFNYPMPENCAGGSTGVNVNGRELHQKDLDLLSSRGLPLSRDRSYIIDISGEVVDEDTGEELNLGKLAPTVEKSKHGFGMRIPRTAAR